MKQIKELFVSVGVIGIGFFLGFLILEGIVRLGGLFSDTRTVSIETVNAKGETIYTPNMDAIRPAEDRGSPSVRVYTNADGFVGNSYSKKGDIDEARILALGDSFTAAVGVNTDKNFVSLLESSLSAQKPTSVMNFGVGGQGTVEQLLRYERTVSEWEHDLVVVFFFSNDFENNQFYIPYQDRFSAGGVRQDIPLSNANNNLGRKDLKYLLLKSSHALQFIDRKVRENATLEALAVKIGLHHAGAMGLPTEGIHPAFFMYQNPLPENHRSVFEFTERVLATFKKAVEEKGARLVLVYLPEATAVDEVLFSEKRASLPSLANYAWDFNQPNYFLKDAASRQGILYLDLSPVFQDVLKKEPQARLYANGEGHFTEAGHEIVAESVGPFLEGILSEE